MTVIAPIVTPTITEVPPTPTVLSTEPPWITPEGYPRVSGWFLTLLALLGTAGLAFWAVSRLDSVRWGLRWAFCMLIGGLLGYNYLALGLPGAAEWVASDAGATGLLVLAFSGELLGGMVAWVWRRWFTESESPAG